ncbi:hypothetical protein BKH43_05065 [Helicobacter sp. 13S00401-1]|uniref:YceI family protein n=1 Tax=Helicobacter sp. 13S00401-1 TaxID=1905758 RepID=UPI000BA770A8|nr:YceI family protein [Helicobacter sp. 13S00401-1]PAF50274.1 hypothetical protein BKH43_05065 [Helicobacter sp. 13S00401-1]
MNKMLKSTFLVLVMLYGGALLAAGNMSAYKIDKANSKVSFQGSKIFVVPVKGVFKDFDGVVDLNDKGLAKLEGKVVVNSVNSKDETRDEHIRGESLFDSTKYPYITFKMTSFEALKDGKGLVKGVLSMHGVEKNITLESSITKTDTKATLILTGEVNVKKDFGMKSYAIMNNNVKFSVNLALDRE